MLIAGAGSVIMDDATAKARIGIRRHDTKASTYNYSQYVRFQTLHTANDFLQQGLVQNAMDAELGGKGKQVTYSR